MSTAQEVSGGTTTTGGGGVTTTASSLPQPLRLNAARVAANTLSAGKRQRRLSRSVMWVDFIWASSWIFGIDKIKYYAAFVVWSCTVSANETITNGLIVRHPFKKLRQLRMSFDDSR